MQIICHWWWGNKWGINWRSCVRARTIAMTNKSSSFCIFGESETLHSHSLPKHELIIYFYFSFLPPVNHDLLLRLKFHLYRLLSITPLCMSFSARAKHCGEATCTPASDGGTKVASTLNLLPLETKVSTLTHVRRRNFFCDSRFKAQFCGHVHLRCKRYALMAVMFADFSPWFDTAGTTSLWGSHDCIYMHGILWLESIFWLRQCSK